MMLRGSVLSYDWFKSGEGQGLLAHLTHPATGLRRLYGCLEYPGIPPSIGLYFFVIFMLSKMLKKNIFLTKKKIVPLELYV